MKLLLTILLTVFLIGCATTPPVSENIQMALINTPTDTNLVTAAVEITTLGNQCQKDLLSDKAWQTRAASLIAGCRMQTKAALSILCLSMSGGIPSVVALCLEANKPNLWPF